MFSKFERMVASRYLRSRRREGFISVIAWFSLLGICLGVATLIIVMAVMNGFRQELLDRILGLNAHITISYFGEGIENYDELAELAASVDGVISSSPTIEGQVMATNADANTGALVRGIRPTDLKKKGMISDNITAGNFNAFSSGSDVVIIGSRLAANLGLKVGDPITCSCRRIC